MHITIGTKTPDILSAIFPIGALVSAASLTTVIICESVVSFPTLVALHLISPEVLRVAAYTLLPSLFSTGMLSPVIDDSSTELLPSMITPSTGIRSSAFTTNTSSTLTLSISTSFSAPFSSTITAFLATSFMRFLSALVVLPFMRASSIFPTLTRVRITAADSKYSSS